MHRCILAIIMALILAGSASASPSTTDRSEALIDFDFAIKIVRDDYAGFPDKTKDERAAEFGELAAKQRTIVIEDAAKLGPALWSVLSWFGDNHLGLSQKNQASTMQQSPAAGVQVSQDVSELAEKGPFHDLAGSERYFDAPTFEPSHPVGKWRSTDGNYTVAILPDGASKTHFVGVILETKNTTWSRGQEKFAIFRADSGWGGLYRMGDHSEHASTPELTGKGALLRFPEINVAFERIAPQPEISVSRLLPPDDFSLTRLSSQTILLRLPNFFGENRARIEELLAENHKVLVSTPNLVIDMRDNNGGSDASYRELMRYLYTRPIYSVGVQFRSTPRNVDLLETNLEEYDLPEDTAAYVRELIANMRSNLGGWTPSAERPLEITTHPEIMAMPKRVGILAEGAGSSGDQFVLDARFSKKVTTFGGNTSGVIDYSNVVSAPLPSGNFELSWPISRSLRLPEEPLDGVGIPADIPFETEIDDPIGYVQAWLERQVD